MGLPAHATRLCLSRSPFYTLTPRPLLPLLPLQAGCASAAACLWDVTDRDLDRYTRAFVSTWLLPDYAEAAAADADGPIDLPLAAALSRGVCKLPALVGLAPVCYGLPVDAVP